MNYELRINNSPIYQANQNQENQAHPTNQGSDNHPNQPPPNS